jgi:NADH-quinone oxidoreductase subunit L
MTVPLLALAVASTFGGFWGIETWYSRQFGAVAAAPANFLQRLIEPFAHAPVAATGGLLAVAIGFAVAFRLYRGAVVDPLPQRLGAGARWLRDRFYFDELYARLIAWTQDAAAAFVNAFDRWIVGGALVRGTSGAVELAGRLLRLAQTGNLQTYAFLFAAGVVVVLFFVIAR